MSTFASPLRRRAEQVPCPECGAGRGEDCKYEITIDTEGPFRPFHKRRYEVAKQELEMEDA